MTASRVDAVSTSAVHIRAAVPQDMPSVRACIQEYTTWLDEDISFQNYTEEFDNLPGKYAPPTGGIFVAVDASSDDVLGCIALRALDLQAGYLPDSAGRRYCELKRLYVYPKARGRQAARLLIHAAVQSAAEMGYDEVLLDTLPKMRAAVGLYESEGFRETRPYYYNPLEGVLFFLKRLGKS
ncbi:hypothetical protein QQS21_001483 [Conoideocrella luteorostrata]|uniref:N-acetyltransferase domain-containing protein n=1 Tax=Conoideocrella luteorostrata TaxID=1105319 RepID=A0AAJ0CZU6_9HYPO|nr:hypothetical protein QQS21_001483 [Conoideocrella luteorostrata]